MPHGRDPRGRGGVWCAGIVCRATHQTWAGRSTARRRFGRPRGRAYRFISHRRAVRGRPREERERKGRTSASSREPASTSLAREPHPLTFVRIFCFLFFCSSETKNKKNTKQKYKRERRGGGPRRGLEARKSKAGRLDFARLPMVGGVRWVLVKLCPRSERLLAHDRRLCSTAAAAHPTKTRAPFDIAEFKDRRPRYDRANRCRGYKLPPSACMKEFGAPGLFAERRIRLGRAEAQLVDASVDRAGVPIASYRTGELCGVDREKSVSVRGGRARAAVSPRAPLSLGNHTP